MAWKFTNDRPVYLQIAERLERKVLSGEYKAGEQIPTVRQIALEATVNPNTVQHAFAELESEGIILSRGTLGRFVTEEADAIEALRLQMAERLVSGIIKDLEELSVTKEQAIKMIEEAYK